MTQVISGDHFKDERGQLSFFNTFDMTGIKRMYQIEPVNTSLIRAWQGHEMEQKWFYCTQGSFIINVVKVNDFTNPNPDVKVNQKILSEDSPQVLHILGGYATGIQATQAHSNLLVFSDFSVSDSKNDDYRFKLDYWKANWQ